MTPSMPGNSTAIASNLTSGSELYLAELLGQHGALDGSIAPWLDPLRQMAADRVRLMSLPTQRDEDWRFTSLNSLKEVTFRVSDATLSGVTDWALSETDRSRLVFVNGKFAAEFSDVSGLPTDVTVGNLANLSVEQQEQVRSQFSLDGMDSGDVFALLNSACLQDMAVVIVGKDCVVETPIQLLFVSTAGDRPSVSHPRCTVVAERGSAATIVEQFVGVGAEPYLTNAVTEITLAPNAQLNHCKWQAESEHSFHIARTAIAQERDSRYTCHTTSTGARLSRHTLAAVQQGLNGETILNGLTVASGTQLSDTHTAIDHAQPHGTSQQIHKCIVGDRAHSVFNGKVLVRKHAQKIDSSQSSRNLLLSHKARVDTKPQLEIFADDVKCAHGATVSQLEADEVFYLQSRGLSEAKAKQLLTYAFAVEVAERIPVKSLENQLKNFLSFAFD
ncbi:Fe-S cluster assembly protein SufD [Synechococcus sp. PCC 7336]|uniref:Fe-S cluster assembly protein SufD n=1 Tax=Synechococcus sp. PCC 7336 TaxID=195250 RepID=UPI00034DC6D3|nr:Fe-S cluster assembly protein SufD [Synechococcus sp. PCC 7336]